MTLAGFLFGRAVKGLLVLGLAFYGAWAIYHPAGFLVAAALLLLDIVTDRPSRGQR